MNKQSSNNNIIIRLNEKHTLFVLSNINKDDKLAHTIASLYFLRDVVEINTLNITQHLKALNIDKLNIFYITNSENNIEKLYNYTDLMHLRIYIVDFEEVGKLISGDSFNEFNQYSLYILEDIKWYAFVKLLIRLPAHITVSGGSAGKRHLISRLDGRLVSYMLAIFNLNFSLLNVFNKFDSINKDSYLPFFDFSNRGQIRATDTNGNIQVINIMDKLYGKDNKGN